MSDFIKLRSFTKNDWMGYCGATELPNGKEPMIADREMPNEEYFVVIVSGDMEPDTNKFCVYSEHHMDLESSDNPRAWDKKFDTEEEAIAYASMIINCPSLIDKQEELFNAVKIF